MLTNGTGPSPALGLSGNTSTKNNFAAKADSIGLGGPKNEEATRNVAQAAQALAGSNSDVVKNRHAIRMANMSAAEVLKAELAGLVPVKKSTTSLASTSPATLPSKPASGAADPSPSVADEDVIPGFGGPPAISSMPLDDAVEAPMSDSSVTESPHGTKRKHDEAEEEDATIAAEDNVDVDGEADDDAPAEADTTASYALKVNADGTVEQEDTVK